MDTETARRLKIVFVHTDAENTAKLSQFGLAAGFRCRAFSSVEDFLDGLEWMDKFNCIVTEHSPLGVSAEDLLGSLRKRSITVPVIVLAADNDVAAAVRCVKLGAHDFMLQTATVEEVFNTIRSALNVYRPDESMAGSTLRANSLSKLTVRQRQIVSMVAEGLTSKDIANKLGLSFRTVETHRSHIMKQLNVRSTAELVRLAMQHPFAITSDVE